MSIKSVELSNPNSCLNRAAPDEPVFVLRANDPCAPRIVRQWALAYRAAKEDHNTDGHMTAAQKAKMREAQQLAEEMERWHEAHA